MTETISLEFYTDLVDVSNYPKSLGPIIAVFVHLIMYHDVMCHLVMQ